MIFDKARVLIRTEKLYKSYRFEDEMKEALEDINIRILQGEFIIIEGLSGSRKNAFFNLIGCIEKPDDGKYFFDYDDITLAKYDMLDGIRKNKIGYMFRNFNLITRLTAVENIQVPMLGLNISRKEKNARIVKVLKSLEIEEIASEKVNNLSECSKQMVSLARAAINDPLMIIADEPAENLDSKGEQKLMEYLLNLNNGGMTIILITDKVETNILSHYRLISFEGGRIFKDSQVHGFSLVERGS